MVSGAAGSLPSHEGFKILSKCFGLKSVEIKYAKNLPKWVLAEI